jgi:hypothetical protein
MLKISQTSTEVAKLSKVQNAYSTIYYTHPDINTFLLNSPKQRIPSLLDKLCGISGSSDFQEQSATEDSSCLQCYKVLSG